MALVDLPSYKSEALNHRPRRHSKGLYVVEEGQDSLDRVLLDLLDPVTGIPVWDAMPDSKPGWKGFADTMEQIENRVEELVPAAGNHMMQVREVSRTSQVESPEWAQFRWAQANYIGTETLHSDRLATEPKLQRVWWFRILELCKPAGCWSEFKVSTSNIYEVVALLHNATKPLGMGFLHATSAVTVAEVCEDLSDQLKTRGQLSVDYYRGRPLKVKLKPGWAINFEHYNQCAIESGAQTTGEQATVNLKTK